MPNKNSIESEIEILVNSVCSHAIPRPEAVSSILTIIQREVMKGRVEELRKIEPPEVYEKYAKLAGHDACSICGFDAILFRGYIQDRLEELEG